MFVKLITRKLNKIVNKPVDIHGYGAVRQTSPLRFTDTIYLVSIGEISWTVF